MRHDKKSLLSLLAAREATRYPSDHASVPTNFKLAIAGNWL